MNPEPSLHSPENPAPPLLRLRGITKQFGPVAVLERVDFEVAAGEVHALVGENGAGKSTLMHIIAGIHSPDAGTMDFAGETGLRIASARHAQMLGIATVFQERALFPDLTVAENIFTGRQPLNRWGGLAHRQLAADTGELLAEIGLAVAPDTLVADLSPDQQQLVEIAKALSLQARLIIFDEPTAALTERETTALFRVIDLLRARGVSVIYISHRLEEIFAVADRVTVLKDGRSQGTQVVSDTTADELVHRMVGRALAARRRTPATVAPSGPPALQVSALSDPASRHRERTCLRDVGFSAHAGEILALAGLAGAGRTETALSIIGARPRGSGEVRIAGEIATIQHPADAILAGIGYLSEDRKSSGLFPNLSLVENMVAAGLQRFGTWWLDQRAQAQFAERSREQLRIACRSLAQPIAELSGGNQQKCLLARWLLVRPRVLIVDEPTRGVDVGAKAEMHGLLAELARQGTAVIVISSDLPEILAIADRIVVLRQGSVAGELDGATATEGAIMRLAALDVALNRGTVPHGV